MSLSLGLLVSIFAVCVTDIVVRKHGYRELIVLSALFGFAGFVLGLMLSIMFGEVRYYWQFLISVALYLYAGIDFLEKGER